MPAAGTQSQTMTATAASAAFQRSFATEPCDRDALLELAEVMQDDSAICPHEDCREHIEMYADRIREALGNGTR